MTRAADTTERQRAHASPSSRDAIADWLDVLERMLALPQGARRAIRAELEDHLRSRVDDLTITGLSEPEAVRAAVSELGETAALARRFKDAGRNRTRRLWMHALAFTLVGGALTLGTLTLGQGALPGASGPVG
ncbi:MAG: permease prefix domain 1-containing protein, partial [Planctomycetota bacterium]